MTAPRADTVVEALLDRDTYPARPSSIDLIETHISWVAIADDLVYKCKKPVGFDFLDFTTLEQRKRACEDEVRLNRRLAPDTYLGVVPLTQQDEGLRIGGAGTPIEWLVQMRKLPVEQALDQRISRGALTTDDIDCLAQTLVSFYREQPPLPISGNEYRAGLVKHVQQNRKELLGPAHQLPADLVKRIHAYQLQLLHLQPELFDQRAAAGRIVEGHGDFRPEHICLTNPPIIFDCIEFNREFRVLDVADELAFLASECDHLGAAWVGPQLFARYEQQSDDHVPPRLINFYKSYRACVRAKVAALRATQQSGTEKLAATREARRYLEQAGSYLQDHPKPLLLVTGGKSGSGKSTLAMALAERLGADVLRTDVIRDNLFGRQQSGGVDAGIYRPELRDRVYEEMFAQATNQLGEGLSVILDATFGTSAAIETAHQIAKQQHAYLLAIECVCPPAIARARIEQRRRAGNDASQADLAVFAAQQATWQPWPAEVPQCRIDSTQPLDEQLQSVFRALAE